MSANVADQQDPRLAAVMREVLDEIGVLSADLGPDVQAAVQAAHAEPLGREAAERLYTRILGILRAANGSGDADRVANEVRNLLAGRDDEKPWGNVALVERNGLKPHLVQPVPIFNGRPVSMYEGYVDVASLDLWQGNHRVELQVSEFKERHGRDPDDEELLQLVQGHLSLPSLTKKDPYKLKGLIESIARKGVERPPILTSGGEPKDGNRRIAASKAVLEDPDRSREEKERARWVKVWVAPPETGDDLFEAIVVALNFEEDFKEKWPEFVKARLVVAEYRRQRDEIRGAFGANQERALRKKVGEQFAISMQAVARYQRMVQWAEDFEAYHVEEQGRDAAAVRYKADDIFQWFYEIQAGRGAEKIVNLFDENDEVRRTVYDLMFEVMDSGTQVRSLYKVIADPQARQQLDEAHNQLEKKDREAALEQVKEAVNTADRNTAARKKIGFESFLRSCVDRLGSAPPDNWMTLDADLLRDLERVFVSSVGVIDGQLVSRGLKPAPAA